MRQLRSWAWHDAHHAHSSAPYSLPYRRSIPSQPPLHPSSSLSPSLTYLLWQSYRAWDLLRYRPCCRSHVSDSTDPCYDSRATGHPRPSSSVLLLLPTATSLGVGDRAVSSSRHVFRYRQPLFSHLTPNLLKCSVRQQFFQPQFL